MSDLSVVDIRREAGSDVMEILNPHRVELTAYCYRMLGSPFEAEDAVQETMLRAWRSFDRFEGRASVRTWLYRIASNVCLDMLKAGQRRARPMDLSAPGSVEGHLEPPLTENTWIGPIPDAWALEPASDPAEQAMIRDSVRLAFIAALQHLPPRQRAVLILRDVLDWRANETAELLDTSVASVNSALQRARSNLAATKLVAGEPNDRPDQVDGEFLSRYVEAFQTYDMDSLTALIREDAIQSMPPYALWLRGRDDILKWWVGPGASCRGSRLLPAAANGSLTFGQYRPNPAGGFEPWAVQVFEVAGGQIVEFTFFLDAANLFPLFGLPLRLDA
ncbi:MAG: sigma-70 family RNA polymerase sigma factor [Actinomycetota bacterium]